MCEGKPRLREEGVPGPGINNIPLRQKIQGSLPLAETEPKTERTAQLIRITSHPIALNSLIHMTELLAGKFDAKSLTLT